MLRLRGTEQTIRGNGRIVLTGRSMTAERRRQFLTGLVSLKVPLMGCIGCSWRQIDRQLPSSGGGAGGDRITTANAVAMARQMGAEERSGTIPRFLAAFVLKLLLLKWGSRTDCMMTVVKSCISAIDDAGIPITSAAMHQFWQLG